eukprot:749573-Hanusia_phi.AAC.3
MAGQQSILEGDRPHYRALDESDVELLDALGVCRERKLLVEGDGDVRLSCRLGRRGADRDSKRPFDSARDSERWGLHTDVNNASLRHQTVERIQVYSHGLDNTGASYEHRTPVVHVPDQLAPVQPRPCCWCLIRFDRVQDDRIDCGTEDPHLYLVLERSLHDVKDWRGYNPAVEPPWRRRP